MTLPNDIARALMVAVRHLRNDDIAAYAAGAMTEAERSRVAAHLRECTGCRKVTEQVAAAIAAEAGSAAAPAVVIELKAVPLSEGKADAEKAPLAAVAESVRSRSVQWSSSLLNWPRLEPEWGMHLAAGRPGYSAVESPLETLVSAALLKGALAWAVGPLVVGLVRDSATGEIRSVTANVGLRTPSPKGVPLELRLFDLRGRSCELLLPPTRGSCTRRDPKIQGELEEFTLEVSTSED